MAYVAVDKDGREYIYSDKPERVVEGEFFVWVEPFHGFSCDFTEIPLPKGMIKKMIGRPLTWEDEPVELKEE